MAFKKSLAAVVFALSFILGHCSSCSRAKRLGLGSPCEFLEPIKTDLIQNLFENECGDAAHDALRLSFHDAIGYSPRLGGGGADGSIIVYNKTELIDPGNVGIDDVLGAMSPFYYKHANAISPGDFIQFAAALSLSLCPGAPRVNYFIGRKKPTGPAPLYIVPQPVNTTDELLAAFAEVGFSAEDLVALLGSHTVAGVDDFAPPLEGIPFDSTPSDFDTNFYLEVLLKGTLFPRGATSIAAGAVGSAIEGTIRLQSDFEIARDKRTSCFWQSFATDHDLMTTKFANAFFRMGLLGQANNHNMIDCSSVIPQPMPRNNKIEYPPGKSIKDIDQSCSLPFPKLATAPGPPLNVSPIPQDGS